MSNIKNNWFIISSGLAPIYKSPTFNSNYLTEALYGESCKILDMMINGFMYNVKMDIIGWVNKFYGYQSNTKIDYSYIIAYPNI